MFALNEKQLKKLEDWTRTLPVLPENRVKEFAEHGRFDYSFCPNSNYVAVTVTDYYSEELFCNGDESANPYIDLTELPTHLA
jgi:hypothetical protein